MSAEPPVTRKQLREFGLIMGAAIALMFGVVFPWLHGRSLPWEQSHPTAPWIFGIALSFWSLALLAPFALKPVYISWMRVGLVLGWVNTRIILGIVFYGLVTPMGLIMRLLNYDPLQRQRDPSRESYRQTRPNPTIDMEKPY